MCAVRLFYQRIIRQSTISRAWDGDMSGSGKWAGRGTATERGYGTLWGKIRKVAMARDSGLCQPCVRSGKITKANEVDHIVPKSKGGADDLENLQAICKQCHKEKTAMEANGGEIRKQIGLDGWPAS